MKIVCSNCETENGQDSKYCSACGYQLPKTEPQMEPTVKEVPRESKTETQKRKKAGAILGVVFGVLLTAGVIQYFSSASSIDVDSTLAYVASEINKNCPMHIDQDLRLDNTMAMPNKTLQYNYSIVNYQKEELNMEVLETTLFTGILENIQTNPDMKEMRESKVTFNYYYKDKNGVFVTKYVVTPEMYEEK